MQGIQGSTDGLGAPQKRSPAWYDLCVRGKVLLYLSLLLLLIFWTAGHFPGTVVWRSRPGVYNYRQQRAPRQRL
ncbi:hypothetical protein TNCV_488351 [Trichonephila clavipes]|nr:hypothetical protein TNCV_488351 [Trichonephila clavipes]